MAKIAVELEGWVARRTAGASAVRSDFRVLAHGDGWPERPDWIVGDAICTAGPQDRPFEERHSRVGISIVVAGSFEYRSAAGRAALTPGSLLLGSLDRCYECGHAHGTGDRCLSFGFTPEYFERVAADAGVRGVAPGFPIARLPALRVLSPLIARALAGLTGDATVSWEEIGVRLAAETVHLACGTRHAPREAPPGAVARVTRTVRAIERHPELGLPLGDLARHAGLSPYHFLRTFERVTGLTPHQYILRGRLREAARRLAVEPARILDIALDCGFGDVSNFNRAFRTEFGVSPRAFRRAE